MKEKFYKPSNQFSFLGFLLLIISTAVVGSVLSIPYLYLNRVCPYIYLTILVACGYGLVLGLIAGKFIKALKLRNPSLAGFAMLIGGAIFTYFKWAFYVFMDLEKYSDYWGLTEKVPLLNILKKPQALWEVIVAINEEGRWGIGRSATTYVNGTFLWVVWIAEAALLIGLPIFLAMIRCGEPFIEKENEWAREFKKGAFIFEYYNAAAYKPAIVLNPNEIFNHRSTQFLPKGGNYVILNLRHSFDFTENYITLSEMRYNVKNKRYDSIKVFQYLAVDFDFVDRLFDHCNVQKPFVSRNNYKNAVAVEMPSTEMNISQTMTDIEPK